MRPMNRRTHAVSLLILSLLPGLSACGTDGYESTSASPVTPPVAGPNPTPNPGPVTPPVVTPGGPGAGGPVVTPSSWTDLGTRTRASRRNTPVAQAGAGAWKDYETPTVYPESIIVENIAVEMDDGVLISLKLQRPALAGGGEVGEPLPSIVTFTPYNKNIGSYIPLGGGLNPYFIERGYNHLLVDVRGTGRSGGSWDPFSRREQQDYAQVLDWVVAQPWSNGSVGLWGISATATTSMFAAQKGHPSVKAVFAIVPHGDIYRDVVFVGGQASVAFLPAWMSVVNILATFNHTFYDDPQQYFSAVGQHLVGTQDFLIPRTAGVLLGEPDSAFDNDYWAAKAPLETSPHQLAPTFIVGGLYDIFQRSEPLNYEALKNHTTTKLLIGPWHHLQAAVGEGLPMQDIPAFDPLAMMWLDRYLKNTPNGAESLPNVTQWVWGHEAFVTASDWPHPQAKAQRYFLQSDASLATTAPAAGAAPTDVLQQPFNGVCSESALQISLGLTGYVPLPCWYDDSTAQLLEATFDTPVLDEDLYINGPIQADIWMSTTAMNAGVVVRVSDLQPDGTAAALSSGLLTASLRAVDASKSRYLDGEMIQPWHPFTAEEPLGSEPVKVSIEVFPTSALIRKGHQLRISVGASNFPFAAMPAASLAQSAAGILSIYSDADHPSSVVLPTVEATTLSQQP